MGTSRNDPSPDKGSWRLVRAIVGRSTYTPERQTQEIWRAAAAERHELLFKDFSTNTLATASKIAGTRTSIAEALDAYDTLSARESHTTLALEFGRRALARCISVTGSSGDFAAELFAEATSYYISRDLPSYVGAAGRVKSSSEAIALKDEIRRAAQERVRSVASRPREQWPSYVQRVISALQKGMPPRDRGKP